MSFLTPIGLLGLIGILLLILIYVLKPKYQEKSISSTFVWKLSLKYKRQKLPFQWLKSSLLVILQFSILLLLTLALTTPLFALDTQSGEKIIILDASANMFAESSGRTRFERAVDEIGALADRTTPDDRFTVILAGEEASFIARRLDSSKFIKQLLSELSPSFGSADMSAAISLTEGVLAENPNAEVILFTGNQYSEIGTITVRDMSRNEWNVSILDFNAKLENGYYTFRADIASFNENENVAITLYVDGQMRDVQVVEAHDNEIITVTWDSLYVINYDHAEVKVDYEDDFIYDNEFSIYGWENELFTVQLVSDSPRFLQAVLLTIGNYKIDVPVAPDVDSPLPVLYEGYDLYVFDSYLPEQMPIDGAVWLINPPDVPTGLDFVLGPELDGDFTLSTADEIPAELEGLLNLVNPSHVTVSKYAFINHDETYQPILNINDDPVVLTKDIDGQKIVIFGFSLHQSNLPIIPEFILLTYNLSRYSVQNMVSQYLFEAGDLIQVRKKASALEIEILHEDDVTSYTSFPVSFIADKPGKYTVTQNLASGESMSVDFFVRIADNQSNFDYDYGILSNPIVANTGTDVDADQDTLDIVYILAALLIVLLLIEWGLHYNEHN